jgi:hypothetical protein
MINLRNEVKSLQKATKAENGYHLAMDYEDGKVYVYPSREDYRKAWDFQSLYLLSRFYNGQWEDRERFIVWGQGFIDNGHVPALPVPVPLD